MVTTDDGEVGYDKLLLATGSEPRRFAAADESGARVAYLRTLDDCASLRSALQEQPRRGDRRRRLDRPRGGRRGPHDRLRR